MSLFDKLSKMDPAGRGASLLTQKDIKEIGQARNQGYSWQQIWEALGKYNSSQSLYQAYHREIEDSVES